MEDLYFNQRADFTRWVTKEGLLHEPLVVVDVGVQGDANARWARLGDHLVLHGFDAIAEVIDELKQRNLCRANRHFHNVAIGARDEQRDFFFNSANPFSSSMFRQGDSRFDVSLSEQVRSVPVRHLDGLLAEGAIPRCDFLKVDVEGFEKEVFLGARELMAAGVLGIETETNFGISTTYPKGHFSAISEIVLESHLLMFDLGFNRVPRASFQRAVLRKGLPLDDELGLVGRPATFNVLFCRDLIEEADHSEMYPTPCRPVSVDQMIKMMIIYELHGLNDVAVDTAERFAQLIGSRLDVDRAVALLADPDCRGEVVEKVFQRRVRELETSTSWRITAPLRALKLAGQRLVQRKPPDDGG